MHCSGRLRHAATAVLIVAGVTSRIAPAQVVDNPGFKALPRPINYATPLAPASGPKAVIVYGKLAPWTQKAAESVQKAIEDWSGIKLDITDDRTVTSEETWLLTDAYRKTPLIVLGNAQDNRVMHALGTRYLLQSNRSWPGGDRFIVRSVFEPFVADVNWIILEASTAAGLNGAAAKFADLLKGFPKHATGAIPLIRELGGTQDAWAPDSQPWTAPAEYGDPAQRSVAQIAAAFKGTPPLAGDDRLATAVWKPKAYVCGGLFGQDRTNVPRLSVLSPDQMRVMAAMLLNGCRAAGGRTHMPMNHYGALNVILALRSLFQMGILDEQEINEFENCMVLSAAYPNEYWYDHISSDSGFINEIGDRHAGACLLVMVNLLDYVRNHCRLDDKTRKEIERRAEGARSTTSHYVRSFRDNFDTWELGETTMLYFYAMLHQGFPENIRNGNLGRSADCYILTTDDIPDRWKITGCYAGLDSYIGSMLMNVSWHGKGIVCAAAMYYDDPGYRWFARRSTGCVEGYHGSVGGPFMGMHWDTVGGTNEPSRYRGVQALPFDERMYELATDPKKESRWVPKRLGVPAPRQQLVDRVAFRDGMDPLDAYLFLATSQSLNGPDGINPLQNNSIVRLTDLGAIWLYTNTKSTTGWSRNMVSISNGKPYQPFAGCTLEALANLGEFSAVAARDAQVSGTAWTRTVVHWRSHYFVVLDRIEALADGDCNLACRWRSAQPAALKGRVWIADASNGSSLHVQGTDNAKQTAEHWECDGSAAPYVLSQFKRRNLLKGQAETFQNLLYVAGEQRPDEFEARRVGANAVMVRGKTAAGDHLALIGTARPGSPQARDPFPLAGFETDAAIYTVAGNTLHLAGLQILKAKTKKGWQELFRAEKPVNLLLNCETGQGEIEADGKTTALPEYRSQILPQPAGLMAALWKDSPAQRAASRAESTGGRRVFRTMAGADRLRLPMRRLTKVKIAATPPPAQAIDELSDRLYTTLLACNVPTWSTTTNLEIALSFPEPMTVACVRVVSIMRDGLGDREANFGQPWNEGDDFTFTLMISNDGFQEDRRLIERPKVRFENTPLFGALYYSLSRLPTWRIELGEAARQIRILPRAAKQNKPELCLTEIEAYAPDESHDLAVKAFAADVDGDGGNELVVGSSGQEVAVYGASGKRLWSTNTAPHNVFTMTCDDLDDDGKTEVLAYTTDEKLHRFNGDGTERLPPADILEAQRKNPDVRYARTGGIVALGSWKPDSAKARQVALFAQGMFFADDDGQVRFTTLLGEQRGAGRIAGLFPNEPEVMAGVNTHCVLWSARRDPNGEYVKLGSLPMAGPGGSACARSFGWVQPVSAGACKGILAANEGGLNWFPIEAFQPGNATNGWGFNTGGVPVVGALAEDINDDGVPEVFLARQDGFVNAFKLADGSSLGLLNTGEPILGMAMLRNRKGKLRLAVGTKFGVYLFGTDLKRIGSLALSTPAVAFAGPGGKDRDRVYVVNSKGGVNVLVLK